VSSRDVCVLCTYTGITTSPVGAEQLRWCGDVRVEQQRVANGWTSPGAPRRGHDVEPVWLPQPESAGCGRSGDTGWCLSTHTFHPTGIGVPPLDREEALSAVRAVQGARLQGEMVLRLWGGAGHARPHPHTVSRTDGCAVPSHGDDRAADNRGGAQQHRRGVPGGRLQVPPEPSGYAPLGAGGKKQQQQHVRV